MNMILDMMGGVLKNLLMPVIAGLVCGIFVSWQAKRSLGRREFLDRVNFSLNLIKDGRLLIRTLIEKPGAEVFLNPEITKMVNRAASRTTEEDSLLPMAKPDDYWLCLNALLNEVSEKFSDGYLKQDMNPAARTETYVMCLTCEVSKNIKTRKLRAMLIKKSLLVNFPPSDPQVDYPTHTTRIVTLRQIARDYLSGEKSHCFVELELSA
jgi:hypothetical protein